LGLGIFLWGQYTLCAQFLSPSVNALGVVLAGAVWTRGLHWDGLADSADALLSHRSPEQMLKIMRDSRIGTMGALALIFDVLVRWQILSHLSDDALMPALIVPPVLSRMAMGLGLIVFSYARESGRAKAFLTGLRRLDLAIVLGSGVTVGLVAVGALGLFAWSSALLIALGIFVWCKRRLGGYTGDILGAVNELIEIVGLGIMVLA
jgi:adenosylcobinamide-GDP ribazoletransferase